MRRAVLVPGDRGALARLLDPQRLVERREVRPVDRGRNGEQAGMAVDAQRRLRELQRAQDEEDDLLRQPPSVVGSCIFTGWRPLAADVPPHGSLSGRAQCRFGPGSRRRAPAGPWRRAPRPSRPAGDRGCRAGRARCRPARPASERLRTHRSHSASRPRRSRDEARPRAVKRIGPRLPRAGGAALAGAQIGLHGGLFRAVVAIHGCSSEATTIVHGDRMRERRRRLPRWMAHDVVPFRTFALFWAWPSACWRAATVLRPRRAAASVPTRPMAKAAPRRHAATPAAPTKPVSTLVGENRPPVPLVDASTPPPTSSRSDGGPRADGVRHTGVTTTDISTGLRDRRRAGRTADCRRRRASDPVIARRRRPHRVRRLQERAGAGEGPRRGLARPRDARPDRDRRESRCHRQRFRRLIGDFHVRL